MPEIPEDISVERNEVSTNTENKDSIIKFKHAISRSMAENLLETFQTTIIQEYNLRNIQLHINPIYNRYENLIGLEFSSPLSKNMRDELKERINQIIQDLMQSVEKKRNHFQADMKSKEPISFTELLGTFRIKVIYVLIPILISIGTATFLGWAAKVEADININVAPYPNENNIGEILYNGFMPVLISAVFITIIYFLIKKFGMIAFKIIMGIVIFFYSWYGLIFFITVFFTIYLNNVPEESINFAWFNGLYLGFFYGSIILFIVLMVFFFSNKLSLKQRNAIVLFYSIFMGAIIGISLPTWTTFAFAIFLSIWDLFTVFKGPLGKIGQMIQDNQLETHKRIKNMLEEGKIGIDQVGDYEQFVSLQIKNDEEGEIDYKKVEVELGSGDLILYSALVANVFINYGSWFLAGLVIFGVILGAILTLYLLLSKKRMLPALPFSMLFGIIFFFVGILMQKIF
ncbi:hypothetical protein [Candidatus Harpocratesius sp.]